MKVMTIMGTRPEMIKMWSVLKKLDSLNLRHSGKYPENRRYFDAFLDQILTKLDV